MNGRGEILRASDAAMFPSYSTRLRLRAGNDKLNLTLAVFSSMANWYAAREDDYRSPVVRGMKRGDTAGRKRILDDDELRAVWRQAEANGTFGAFVRLSLLTGQRKEKVAAMRWEDIDGAVWTIPTEAERRATLACWCFPRLRLKFSTLNHASLLTPTSSLASVALISKLVTAEA